MYKNKITQALWMSAGLAVSAGSFSVVAAQVPEGVKLADSQELVRNNGSEVESLDPQKVSGVPESNIIRDLLEGLINQDDKGNLVPGAASSWESSDNKVWTFHLRQDAKWSNGEPVTAEDFVYTWRRLADPKTASPYASYLSMTTMHNAEAIINGKAAPDSLGVEAVDPHTLKVTLDKAVPYFPAMLVHTSMKPVHAKTVAAHGDKWTSVDNYVSNGAYKLDKWVVNERIELVRNENYWDNKETIINKVTYLPIENQVAAMNRFLAGEIDLTYEVPNEHFKRLVKEYPDAIKVTPYLCSYYYEFNTARKPFDDVRVRKALSYAIDRDVIAKFIVGKGETPAYNFTPLATNGIEVDLPDYSSLSQKERVAKAKELLKEAGYGDKPLTFDLLYNTSENHKKIAVAIASMWKKSLGVTANLENQEWKSYLDSKRQGNFDVSRAGWCGDYNEASTFLAIMRDGHSQNYPKYTSKAYDKALDDALAAASIESRAQAYKNAESLLATDMPIMPIYHYVNARLVNPKVGGYPMKNPEDNIYSKDLYIIAK
ncbi:ABC transporter substrate-binding protein [Photobacterium damselae subsp. damselae]|uniref:Oligopeptide ABC transporter substrate-binding protein OppA n=1 Tax=Photobacterium damselae subsp. damselae TaxID=85581 RepID=A0AAD3WTX2_PHODD|nr:ABC transporter substrate-binding protein [Photobacterium damselae]KAB1177994.1 oligopeptide ABC transporter substrate-binding protein OppA [Photobacterium damselae subsp. damselae]PSB81166.1 oligopeptide ABC transporter substrate-binding protein OppA [Photobacterium damselae subsp. damselae]QSH58125.1 oligopeptide ABC transporter substrate-binding protein OppA [Photobacterium damselae subsp. damselae]UKA02665.1 ABC transporter substrate-binding protein [Photobacterium damselae subsp. damsel